MFCFILKVLFYSKSRSLHISCCRVKTKNTCLIFVIPSDDNVDALRCCCDPITLNTQSFSLTSVMRCFRINENKLKDQLRPRINENISAFIFPFRPEEDISVSSKLSISITFSQLWRNSSQLAHLFKVKVALSPYLNTAHWFTTMASVQKQQGHLSGA